MVDDALMQNLDEDDAERDSSDKSNSVSDSSSISSSSQSASNDKVVPPLSSAANLTTSRQDEREPKQKWQTPIVENPPLSLPPDMIQQQFYGRKKQDNNP